MDIHKITTYQAGIMQAAMHRKLQRFSDEVLKPYGITKNHWLIIGIVRDHKTDGVRITEIAELLGTTMSYMTNTVNLLESRNILTRDLDTKDSRSRIVKVHPSFDSQCDNIEIELRERLRDKVYAHVTEEEFAAYVKVIAKLSKVD